MKKVAKIGNFLLLYAAYPTANYEQASPLAVSIYSFGHAKARTNLAFVQFVPNILSFSHIIYLQSIKSTLFCYIFVSNLTVDFVRFFLYNSININNT